MDVLKILLIVGLIGYVVAGRMRGRPLIAKDVYVPPVVMVAIGAHGLLQRHLSPADLGWLVVTIALGVLFGVIRAATTIVYAREGVLWHRYTWKTLVVWAVTLAISVGVGVLAVAAGMHAEARSMPLSIGAGLLGEALVILLRSRTAGVPYAEPETSRRPL
ncbi:DUF1453 domain-containing protein [Nonomuraea endophytica]|uniref:DUF1453 domain-containing protein n=1 Tax=Nonomuraea endophytica TaxID=714136 RepID=A0A7W8EMG3_9ACTN|nr:DUF1453 domain-containing protein [Nonomuraea endophytica]MBB5084656.1 hypothetical protein [Nonomuraea endophytica]